MQNETGFSQDNDECAGEGVLGSTLERVCKCATLNTMGSCSFSEDHQGELAPVVVIGDALPLRVSGIGLKIVAVPNQQVLEKWQEKVLELQVLQQLLRCMPRRA